MSQYSDDFYSILKWDESLSSFHLIGASESNIGRSEYKSMFTKFKEKLNGSNFPPIPKLSGSSSSFTNRIGLFPSSTTHLISGPSFSFAPFPVNSSSKFLKFKSKFLSFILSPFLPFQIRSLAYVPLGGKAASKTRADDSLDHQKLPELFFSLREENNFDWYYLEAGSGENFLNYNLIFDVLSHQAKSILNVKHSTILSDVLPNSDDRYIVPGTIYGGGIRSTNQIKTILAPQQSRINLIPEIVIVGNISEKNVSITYEVLELVGEYNELSTISIDKFVD